MNLFDVTPFDSGLDRSPSAEAVSRREHLVQRHRRFHEAIETSFGADGAVLMEYRYTPLALPEPGSLVAFGAQYARGAAASSPTTILSRTQGSISARMAPRWIALGAHLARQ